MVMFVRLFVYTSSCRKNNLDCSEILISSAVVRSQNIGLMLCQQPEINVPVNFNIIHLSNGNSTMNNACVRVLHKMENGGVNRDKKV